MAGLGSKALAFGEPGNKEKTFQGQRYDDNLGLNWVQFKWRNHDSQIGRFIEVDPLSEKYTYNSTFAFSENHVTVHVELEGLEKFDINTDGNRQFELQYQAKGLRITRTSGLDGRNSIPSTIAKSKNYRGLSEGSNWLGTTNSTVTLESEKLLAVSALGDQVTSKSYSGQTFGEKGILNLDCATNTSTNGEISNTFTFSVANLGISTDVSGNIAFKGEFGESGMELSAGINNGGIVAGIGYTNSKGQTTGTEYKYTPGNGTLALVATVVGMLVAPEVTLPKIEMRSLKYLDKLAPATNVK